MAALSLLKKNKVCVKLGVSAEGREKECLVILAASAHETQVSGLVGTRGH